MSEPVFVEKSWVKKVDAELKNDAPPQPVAPPPSSRFYDLRPAVLRTGWTWNDDASSWTAKIRFVVNGEQDATPYDVYAPTFLKSVSPPVTNYSSNPRVYVVWRGRWEVVAFVPNVPEYEGGTGISVDNTNNVITNTGVLSVYIGDTATVPPATSPSRVQRGNICFSDNDFKLDDLNGGGVGWYGVALKNPPRPWTFEAGTGVNVDIAIDSTVTITNTAPYNGVPISYYPAGVSMPQTGSVTRIVIPRTSSASFDPATGTLTLG